MAEEPSQIRAWPAALYLSSVSPDAPITQQVVKVDERANTVLNQAITPVDCPTTVDLLLDMCLAVKEGLEDKFRRSAQGPLIAATDIDAAEQFIQARLSHGINLFPMEGLSEGPGNRGMYVVDADWILECQALHRITWTLKRVAGDVLSRMLDRRINAHCNFMTGLVYEGSPPVHKLVLSFSAQPDPRVSSETMSTVDVIATASDTPHWHRLQTAMRQQLVSVSASSTAHGFGSDSAVTFVTADDEREFSRAVKELVGLATTDHVWHSFLAPSETKEPHQPGQPWHIDEELGGQLSADCSLTDENPTILCSLPLGGSSAGPQLALCDFGDDRPRPWLVKLDEPFPLHLPLASGPFLAGEQMQSGDVFWTWVNCVHRGVRFGPARRGSATHQGKQRKRKRSSKNKCNS